ncbi:hypothetical protein PR202_ga17590 [Eleusine coracana subsp. coracana]|uniref:Uncharacterized protein n=1 Tax=Eleusine coracana subsp. coracana TaxID=191504 RepID=A0AAV5CQU2_ELECO|nr:hypothetical protein PR202_ga17343 [Eleusine coracana subsp. coracana]GJN00409.1 hypothetical protein PR202_ga17590 [Eleusine coracana subsp. coracana]
MSFLAGRIAAAKEGSYFLQESKNAVGRLAQKFPASASPPGPPASSPGPPEVRPETLRHSVPIKGTLPPADASLNASSRWTLPAGRGRRWEGICCCNYFLVFGGATAVLLYTADRLQLHSAEEMSRKWHFEGDKGAKEKSIMVRELSRALGSRSPPN